MKSPYAFVASSGSCAGSKGGFVGRSRRLRASLSEDDLCEVDPVFEDDRVVSLEDLGGGVFLGPGGPGGAVGSSGPPGGGGGVILVLDFLTGGV